ncbi:hypothetical protein [Thalassotalea sp. PS06]|uniref:hypothetical protein n=1 Tax=Thalassotalea sp. PS06 TaxID=2594005 RepID=UPI0011653AFE|nr:hypothetical protein [Thalassotalea sp. PS06]QDP01474.1 hypothetical protein FNC98_09105 [Thalassotalea sp. PS06]
MKTFKHALAPVALLSSLPLAISANAEESTSSSFQHQLSYHNVSSGFSSLFESDNTQVINYRYYFDQVSTETVPVALVNQLAKKSYINGSWMDKLSDKYSGLSGEYIIDDNWFIGGQLSYFDTKDHWNGQEAGALSYRINGGYYFGDYTKINVAVDYLEDDDRSSEAGAEGEYLRTILLAPGGPYRERLRGLSGIASNSLSLADTLYFESGKSKSYIYSVEASHYLKLSEQQGINFSGMFRYYDITSQSVERVFGELEFSSSHDEFGVSADWFITQRWHLGVGYHTIEIGDYDRFEDYLLQTGYHYQFSNGIYLGADYVYDIEHSHELIYLNVGWRF